MKKIIEFCKNINKIDKNSYMNKLKNNPPKSNFITSQKGFINAVDNWSKILALLTAKVPSCNERIIIIKNLFDEHGKGDINNSHVNTFRYFLKSLGNTKKLDITSTYKSSESISTFNNNLEEMIKNKNWLFCVASLGMIEFTYITVSNIIHNYASNYLNPN